MNDRPLQRPYARMELERRFLLSSLPPTIDPEAYVRFDDLYVGETHLRLRRVTAPSGEWITTKLGQKIVAPNAPDDPRQRQMTTIYLPDAEGAVLSAAIGKKGLRTTKRRYKIVEQGRTFCIDVWEIPAQTIGVIVSEVETETLDALERITLPSWAIREVTADLDYTAIKLARRS